MKQNKLLSFIVLSIIIFSLIIGMLITFNTPNKGSVITLAKNGNILENFVHIFLNNIFIAYLIILSGFTLYLIPIGYVSFNFIVFGSSMASAFTMKDFSDAFFLYFHGIFEIPAIGIALYIAITLSTELAKKIFDFNYKLNIKKIQMGKLNKIMIILFLIGAITEAFIINYVYF